jgi:nucleotidyltransferase substrate binding protein (TIGR01987 family)
MSGERTRRAIDSYRQALTALERSVTTPVTEPRDLSGIVKDFEILYELSWRTLKKVLEDAGHTTTTARQVYEVAFQTSLIDDETGWIEMIDDRNRTVHTYNEAFARELAGRIRDRYLPLLRGLGARLPS